MHEVLGKGTFNTTNIDVQDYASLLLMDSKDDLSVTFEKNNIFNFTFRVDHPCYMGPESLYL